MGHSGYATPMSVQDMVSLSHGGSYRDFRFDEHSKWQIVDNESCSNRPIEHWNFLGVEWADGRLLVPFCQPFFNRSAEQSLLNISWRWQRATPSRTMWGC